VLLTISCLLTLKTLCNTSLSFLNRTKMIIPFSSLASLKIGVMDWRVRVRVIRMWTVNSEIFQGKVNSIELILLDVEVSSCLT